MFVGDGEVKVVCKVCCFIGVAGDESNGLHESYSMLNSSCT